MKLILDIETNVDTEADEREHETCRDERETQSSEIAGEGQDEEHDGARHVRRDSIQIRLHGAVAQAGDDLRQEELNGLQGHAQTDFNGNDDPAGGVLEDGETLLEVEFLVHDRGAVFLHPPECELLLLRVQEFGLGR